MRRTLLMAAVPVLLAGCANDAGPADVTGPEAAVTPSFTVGAGVGGSVTGNAIFPYQPAVDLGYPPGLALRRLSFNGIAHGDGSVSGEWQIVVVGTILHGDIDCLTILPDGKSGRISGIVEQAKYTQFQAGTAFAMEFVDNGQGAGADADVVSDLVAFRNAPPEVGRAFCETGELPEGVELQQMEITQGNFQVHADR